MTASRLSLQKELTVKQFTYTLAMTAKQKAKELIDKFIQEVRGSDRYNYNLESMNNFIARKCALIAVDEVLDNMVFHEDKLDAGLKVHDRYFWLDVKKELVKHES